MPKLPDAYGVWMGPIQGPEHYKAKYAVDEVAYVDDMAAVLKAASPPCLHVLSGTNTDRCGKHRVPASAARAGCLRCACRHCYCAVHASLPC